MKLTMIQKYMRRFCFWLALPLFPLTTSAQTAEPVRPPLIPIEKLFAHDDYGNAKLSPDSSRIAIAKRINGRMALAIFDIDSGESRLVANFNDADVSWYRWINNQRLIVKANNQQAGLNDNVLDDSLYAVDATGGPIKLVVKSIHRQTFEHAVNHATYRFPLDQAPNADSDDILLGQKLLDTEGIQKDISIVRINTRTLSERDLSLGIKGRVVAAYADWRGRLRALRMLGADNKSSLIYRADESTPWQALPGSHTLYDGEQIRPEGFSPDGKTMWVSAYNGRDTAGLYAYDLATQKLGAAIFESDKADLDGHLLLDPDGQLLGVQIDGMAPQTHWFDPQWQAMQELIDRALPSTVNVISGDPRGRILVNAYSERIAGRYYLFDAQRRRLTEQFRNQPQLDAKQLAETSLLQYKARDGLALAAFLTLPKGRGSKNLPLVVLPHGGPYSRNHWVFDPEVQLLANRGYVVLQPQFRGTTGFGHKLFVAGHQTWGLSMQDDLEDGINALVGQGMVNKDRICIWGASYGGYAALMGAAKTPDLYRCAISFAGVTDLTLMFTDFRSDLYDSLWRDYGMETFVGNPGTMRAQFDQTSPARRAGSIRAPILLAWSTKDVRVPQSHAKAMLSGLRDNGRNAQTLVLDDEEHGIMKLENRVRYYSAVEEFLKQNNPPD